MEAEAVFPGIWVVFGHGMAYESQQRVFVKLGFEEWLDIFYIVKFGKDIIDNVRRYWGDDNR